MKNILLALVLILPLAACWPQKEEVHDNTTPLVIESLGGAKHAFRVELALTPEELMKGLMFRESMPRYNGMLFFFNDSSERRFWMKNTLIPLDILFLKQDGTIHHVHKEAKPQDLTSIPSYGPVSGVLEINGGLAQELGIKKGDKVRHKLFGNIAQ